MEDLSSQKNPVQREPRKSPHSLKRELFGLAAVVLLAVSVALVLRLYVAQAYEIKGRSMEPTFHDGDRVILLKLAPTLLPIERGDIVIFGHPNNPDRDLVKRVIAKGGDIVSIVNGTVYVNGRRSPFAGPTYAHGRNAGPWVVPEGAYFVLGDNRANSQDSRDFGPVTHDLVKGKVWFRWWPIW